jgi:hypothetical protein
MWFQAIVIAQLALLGSVGQANREAWGTEARTNPFARAILPAQGVRIAKTSPVRGGPPTSSGEGAEGRAKVQAPGNTERSETDLMLEALVRADGESPNAKRIDRAVAQAKADARRDQIAPATVWKDPFADDPTRPIPVRARPRSGEAKGKELTVVRRELARARAETAVAQADAARAKADAAKAEASAALAQAVAARHEAVAARAACVDPGPGGGKRASAYVRPEPRGHPRGDGLVAASLPRAARKSIPRSAEPGPAPAAAAPMSPAPASDPLIVPLADDALVSSHPGGGILVVPITR